MTKKITPASKEPRYQTSDLMIRIMRLHAAIEEYTWTPEEQRKHQEAISQGKQYVSPPFHELDDNKMVERLRRAAKKATLNEADETQKDLIHEAGIASGWTSAAQYVLNKAIAKFTEGALPEAEALRLVSVDVNEMGSKLYMDYVEQREKHAGEKIAVMKIAVMVPAPAKPKRSHKKK